MSTQKHRPRQQQCQLPEDFLCDFLLKKNRFHVVDKKWKPTATAIKRFLQNCRGLTPEMTNCVIWMGNRAHLKYASSPRFYLNGRHVSIQNMVYVWFVNSLEAAGGGSKSIGSPSTQWVTTTCQKRLCVNPLHLKFRRDLKVSAPIRKKRKKRRRKKKGAKKKIQ